MVWKAGQSQQQRRYLNGKKYFCNRNMQLENTQSEAYRRKQDIMNIKDIWDPEDNYQSSSNFSARKRKTGNTRAIIEYM